MPLFSQSVEFRRDRYVDRRGLTIGRPLGHGFNGTVWATSGKRYSAIKVFRRQESYANERDVYLRLQEDRVVAVRGVAVPQLLDFDDELGAIEMSIVSPPYVLDFADAALDTPPDFPEEVWEERESHWACAFESSWPMVRALRDELAERYGIHLMDLRPENINLNDG